MYKIIFFYDAGEVIPIINLCSEDLKAETFYKRFLLMCLLSYEGFNSFLKKFISQNIHALVVISIQPEDTSHVLLLQSQYP